MEHTHSKKGMIAQWVALVLLVLIGTLFAALLWTQIVEAPTPQTSAPERSVDVFRTAYPLAPQDHLFNEINAAEATEMLGSGTGVLMLGFEECPWCQTLVPHLDASARASGVERIDYFNVRQDRTDNTETYQRFVKALEPSLDKDEDGKPRIYVPHVVVIKNGEVVGNYKIALPKDGEKPTPETFWTPETIGAAKDQLKQEFAKLQR